MSSSGIVVREDRQRCAPGPGFTLAEVLVVLGIVTISVLIMLPSLAEFHRKHQLDTAATELQGMLLRARVSALKEKSSYRVVLHDDDDSLPNRYELQKQTGSSWVAVDQGTRALPATVAILGSGSTDSADDVTVSGRGVCTTGKAYLRSENGNLLVVTVDAICLADRS